LSLLGNYNFYSRSRLWLSYLLHKSLDICFGYCSVLASLRAKGDVAMSNPEIPPNMRSHTQDYPSIQYEKFRERVQNEKLCRTLFMIS
jgi:hypothetical protein